MLKVAFMGKGGSGKSAIAGTFARLLAARGEPVLVLDSDPMPGLAISLGVDASDHGVPDDAVEEGPEDGPRFRLRSGLSAAEAIDRYATVGPDGVRLLQLGKLHGHASALVRSQFAFRQIVRELPNDRFHLVGDLPGGTRQPFAGWGRYADTYLVVVEPTGTSLLSARRLTRLSRAWPDDRAPRILALANKVRDEQDLARIRTGTELEIVGCVPWDEGLRRAEAAATAPVEAGGPAVDAVASLVDRIVQQEQPA